MGSHFTSPATAMLLHLPGSMYYINCKGDLCLHKPGKACGLIDYDNLMLVTCPCTLTCIDVTFLCSPEHRCCMAAVSLCSCPVCWLSPVPATARNRGPFKLSTRTLPVISREEGGLRHRCLTGYTRHNGGDNGMQGASPRISSRLSSDWAATQLMNGIARRWISNTSR